MFLGNPVHLINPVPVLPRLSTTAEGESFLGLEGYTNNGVAIFGQKGVNHIRYSVWSHLLLLTRRMPTYCTNTL